MTSPAFDFSSAEPAPSPLGAAMPCNIEAEQALLGTLLYDNAAYERLIDKLQARHFYEPFHQRLFAIMEEHIRRGQLAEPILLADRFKQDAAFEELGGLRYLADLVDRAPPSANAPDYARTIYDLALRRDLIRIGGDISTIATTDAERPARDQIEIAEQQLFSLAETGGASQGFVNFADALHGAVEMAAEAFQRDGGLAGISTGLIDLDRQLGGLHPSDLLILAGRPSMGKSALAANIAFSVARNYAWGAAAGRIEEDGVRRRRRLLLPGNVGRAAGHGVFWLKSRAWRPTSCARARSTRASSAGCATPPWKSRRAPSSSTTPAASPSPSWWPAAAA